MGVHKKTANNTLEEIVEQEESTTSIVSETVSVVQGEDSSLNLWADASLDQDDEQPSLPPTRLPRKIIQVNGERSK